MNVRIREYLDGDFQAVCEIDMENSPEGCRSEVFIRQAGVLFAGSFLVAECDGRVAGYTIGALVQNRPRVGWVIRLVVAEGYRRRGLGRGLLAAVTGRLGEIGAEEVYLTVSPANHGARRLYQEHGFMEVGFCPDYFGDGGDRYILRKGLADRKGLTPLD